MLWIIIQIMDTERAKHFHNIDMACLSILYTSTLACLIRSDYNYAVIFFCYFAWQQRKDKISLNILLVAVAVLIIYDILFFLIEGRVWVQTDPGNTVWNNLYGLHLFGLFCSVIGFALKFALLFFVFQAKKQESRPYS